MSNHLAPSLSCPSMDFDCVCVLCGIPPHPCVSSDIPASWLAGSEISLNVFGPIVEKVACIQPGGGLDEMYGTVPSPERMKDTPPSCLKSRWMSEFRGLLREER